MPDDDFDDLMNPQQHIPKGEFGPCGSIHNPGAAPGRNRHGNIKTVATTTNTVASVGITATTTITGTGAMALAAGGVAAVGATGVGLVAAGAVLTVGSIGTSMRSAYKTNKHINGLKAMLDVRPSYAADCARLARQPGVNGGGGAEHKIIEYVLIYIINQKRQKLFKKGVASCGLGLLTGAQRGLRAGWKKMRGSKGKVRKNAAAWLAKHLVTTHCPLAQAMVAELLDPGTMEYLKTQSTTKVIPVIAAKMKSV